MILHSRPDARTHPLAFAAAQARRTRTGHRLVVAASGVTAVVTHAGGWLFDRVMAGWEVVVLVDEREDRRPLDILGAHVVDLESALVSRTRVPLPQAIAVDPQLYSADSRVRDGITEIFEYRLIEEVTMWGRPFADAVRVPFVPVQHQLSAAARTFKQAALSAAGSRATPAGAAELFLTRAGNSRPRAMRDLAPVSR
ncbi:hypothetical protein ACIBEK_09355 [Nocardia fusca]|uniref:hypothetical protein n=1 Tax=Nocardia fusca TaxID=941183 RepID=UPI003799DAB8